MSSPEPLTIIAVTRAAPGKASALRAAQTALVSETLAEPGCLRYELQQSLDDAHVLILVEQWASESEWQAHMQGAAMQRFRASGAGALIRDFELHRMIRVAGSDGAKLESEPA
jgi:quinol monooxygenase YgiN